MRKEKILVVEDDITTQGLVKMVINVLGNFEAEGATTLKEALYKVKKNKYAYILLDLNLPDSGGIETVKAVRMATEDRIIIVTGINDPEVRDKCMELGVFDFVYKGTITQNYFKLLVEEVN